MNLDNRLIVVCWTDGAFFNIGEELANVGATVISKHFKSIPFNDAKGIYLKSAGVPIEAQLATLFRHARDKDKKACAEEYNWRQRKVYDSLCSFPQAVEAAKAIKANFANTIQTISSTFSRDPIVKWIVVNNMQNCFFNVFGKESGSKPRHIEALKKVFPKAELVVISNSIEDMDLRADKTIGVCCPSSLRGFFKKKGANEILPETVTSGWITEMIQFM